MPSRETPHEPVRGGVAGALPGDPPDALPGGRGGTTRPLDSGYRAYTRVPRTDRPPSPVGSGGRCVFPPPNRPLTGQFRPLSLGAG